VGFFLIGLRSPQFAALWLGCASLVFYSWWHTPDLAVLVGSTAFNFVVGRWLATTRASPTRRGAALVGALTANLALLAYFKYTNFLLGSVASVLGWTTPQMAVVLPLGISFFTFTQIAFLVDTYRGKVRETNPIHYLLFVTYFPHLIAGPVMHHAR
jgi:alginate O-acetyltransferase complex protein AlgI